MKWIVACLVTVATLGCLSDAQRYKNIREPKQPKQPYNPPRYNPPVEPQVPQPHVTQPQMPQHTELSTSCEVYEPHRIRCGTEDISQSDCEADTCCFDGRMCYYGRAVTVQCTQDAQFIVVVAKDATLPQIDLSSVALLGEGAGCTPVDSNSAFAIYQFPVTACGTLMTDNADTVIYENRMLSTTPQVLDGPRGLITRDTTYEVLFQCIYIGTSVQARVIEVQLLPPPPAVSGPGPLRVEIRLGNGQCHTKGCDEEEVAYRSFYSNDDYPVTKVLREPVYVEVRFLERTDPNIHLTLERCWATSDQRPDSRPQWDLLIDGCPNPDDRNYLTSLVRVDESSGLEYPTHHKRFHVKMLTFVDHTTGPLRERVFIHCNVVVCKPCATHSCESQCHRQRRDVKSVDHQMPGSTDTVTSGEVIFVERQPKDIKS